MAYPPKNRRTKDGHRSGFEDRIARHLKELGVDYGYETMKIKYHIPSREATYTPDFILPNGVIVEGKGRFRTAADRQKLILVKKSNPDLDIRLLFQNETLPIYKGSKTTYAMWAETHGFPYASKEIPTSWLKHSNPKPAKS